MSTAQDHGPELAVYQATASGLDPVLFCLCGYFATGQSWEDVGHDFDQHLEEHSDPRP